jgi:hypothetical protein
MGKKLNDAALQEAAEAAKTTRKQNKAAKERKESLGNRKK